MSSKPELSDKAKELLEELGNLSVDVDMEHLGFINTDDEKAIATVVLLDVARMRIMLLDKRC